MKLLIKRTYLREDCTLGCLQVILSGEYESEYINASVLKRHPQGGAWLALCDTLEPHAIPWEDKLLIGQHRGRRIPGKTAIPEGTYHIELRYSKTYKRQMPHLLGVPTFKSVVLRTGKTSVQSRGDILVGDASHTEPFQLDNSRSTFTLLFNLIVEALDYGETVTLEVRSPKEWTYPKARSPLPSPPLRGKGVMELNDNP